MTELTKLAVKINYSKSAALRELRSWKDELNNHFFAHKRLENVPDEKVIKELDRENFLEAFATAEKELQQIEPINLYVAVTLPDELMKKIIKSVRDDLGDDKLVEVRVNVELIGGCAVAYGGKYMDFSLRAKMEKNKDKIRDEIGKVMKSSPVLNSA